jgi:hypothetical protein
VLRHDKGPCLNAQHGAICWVPPARAQVCSSRAISGTGLGYQVRAISASALAPIRLCAMTAGAAGVPIMGRER